MYLSSFNPFFYQITWHFSKNCSFNVLLKYWINRKTIDMLLNLLLILLFWEVIIIYNRSNIEAQNQLWNVKERCAAADPLDFEQNELFALRTQIYWNEHAEAVHIRLVKGQPPCSLDHCKRSSGRRSNSKWLRCINIINSFFVIYLLVFRLQNQCKC